MSERTSSQLFGEQALEAMSDLSKLLSSTTDGDGLLSSLRLIGKMFDGEGAVLWLLNAENQTLHREEVVHLREARSKAFEQTAAELDLKFGESTAGKAWAEGAASLIEQPAMFRQTPELGSAQQDQQHPVRTLAFPLFSFGTICGVVCVVDCSINSLSTEVRQLLSIIGMQLGAFVYINEASERLRAYKEQLGKITAQLHHHEGDVRETKARLSREHEKAVQTAQLNVQFLQKASNDLRTPLSGILGMVELLRRTPLNQQQSEYADIINESSGVLLNVIEDLLEYSNHEVQFFSPAEAEQEAVAVESGDDQKLEQEYLAEARVLVVTGLVGSAEFIEPYATASGIRCESVSRGYSAITAMRQAVRAGEPFDIVFIEMVLPDMDAFELARVIRQDKQLASARLILVSTFVSPTQSEQALKSGFAAHVPRIVKQNQVINIISSVLQGSVYVEDTSEMPHMNMTPAAVTGKPMVLVAEDNPVNQKVALLQLKELGFYAKVVTDGAEAVEAVKEGIYDAVLMDVQMPKMDGFEATKAIRAWEGRTGTHIPIIAVTAHAMSADRDKCLAAGMDDYMSKPVTYDKLHSVLSKWLGVSTEEEQQEFERQESTTMQFSPERSSGQSESRVNVPIDVSNLVEMLGPEETAEILSLFVASTENLLDKINTALDSHDSKLMKEAAHELKGACSSVGADNMAETCKEIEAALKSSDWEAIGPLQNGLAQSFESAKTYISNRFA